MSIVFGILIMIGAIVLMFARSSFRTEDEVEETRMGRDRVKPAHPSMLISLGKRAALVFIAGLLLSVQSLFWFYARQGHQYFVLTPTGSKYAIFDSGVKVIFPFSRIQEWQKIFDIKVVKAGESVEGIEGVINEPIPIRFIDQVTARVSISARMQLPSDDEGFIQLVEDFRHPLNLVNNTLIPTVREQVINTGYMFAAQDYISGEAQNFRQTLDEQLKDGGYSVEKKEYRDTIPSAIGVDGERGISEIRTRYEVTKRERNGSPIRIEHDIKKNKVLVTQVIVDAVDLEPTFKKRLEAQRDESAKRQLEQQKIKTAKDAQARIVAEGERDKAAERVEQEKNQVKTLIAIETKLKEESTNKELAQIQLETARLTAKALVVTKDAEAYANRKLVSAGLTPQEQAKIWKETQIGVAKAMAGPTGIKLPQMYMSGGEGGKSGNSTDMMSQILMMMMAKQSMSEIGKPVKGN